jgi:divinyl protochlorophyllide a 8-vinyl-reductase
MMTPARTAIIDTPRVTHGGARDAVRGSDTATATGTIGPNAVIQLIGPLRDEHIAERVFAAAGAAEWLVAPPSAMVDERRVVRLHRALREAVPQEQARRLLTVTGRLTADYILANRIPLPARTLLKCLPPPVACRLLVAAIRAHAWTFAGSASFVARPGDPTVFTLTGNPLCGGTGNPLCGGTGNPLCAGERALSPVCAWHAAVFQRLFEDLVSPRSRVVETACEAIGDRCCRFEIDWRPSPALPRH